MSLSTIDCDDKYICNLTKEEKRLVSIRFNETDKNRPEKIEEIRKWLFKHPEIISRKDDFSILRFLRACKFDVEKTKVKLKNYYEHKTDVPEWHTNRDPLLPEIQELLEMGLMLPLRKLDKENRLVVLVRVCVHDPKRHTIESLSKIRTALIEVATRNNEAVTLNGAAIIVDVKGATLAHAMQMSVSEIRKLVHGWQGCYPVMLKSMDLINMPYSMEVFFNMGKSLMSSKLKSRVFAHSNDKVLSEKYPKEILPVEYGGTDGCINDLRDYWKEQLERNRDWVLDDEKYKLLK